MVEVIRRNFIKAPQGYLVCAAQVKYNKFKGGLIKMKKFNSKSCEEIMTTVYKPIEFVVDNLIGRVIHSRRCAEDWEIMAVT